ncbi:GAF and ANTAR domain-containing protein [Nocardioides sp. S-58]|uniref:GAF and ANTAR domain-containing protein n=1 Tax=Nocardioides renjunii TaxID=3095075 RepID=A0ABU5KBC9_9ACTN|nr:GAF and ANTAR domain-containing protein [Nocardioides sp. S-58]MDZ5661734.1 GAF and ANTAR domain-containing protein [Nocardioides sp. S-58]
MTEEDRLIEASRQLAAALRPGDLDTTLANITAAAVAVLPDVQWSSLTIRHADGRLETVAPTHDVLLDVDAAQYELREGPCYEAATDTVHVTSPDLAADERFPRYAPVALEAGIRAQAGIRLFDAPGSNGALNLYSATVGAFADLEILSQLFAHQSAVALDYARQIDQLQEAVSTRQLIGQAVGMVRERYTLDEARAFGFLTRLSSHENVKLRTVAERMLQAHDATRS